MPRWGSRGSKVTGPRINLETLSRQGTSWTGLVWDMTINGGNVGHLLYCEFWWDVKGWEEGATLSDKTRITV